MGGASHSGLPIPTSETQLDITRKYEKEALKVNFPRQRGRVLD